MSATLTMGLDAARAVDPTPYVVGGVTPRFALRPTSGEEVAEALRAASVEHLAALPWGGGIGLARSSAPPRYDLALDLSALDRIVEYDPEDLTVTAECGVTLDTLRAALAARAQELPLEAAHAERATLGGVLAANASGPRRLGFGSPRDRILGARFALSDGTIARSGGKVVKNVAGYGIHRLLCGSFGGLAVFLEASLKLLPAPERRAALVYGLARAAVVDAARWASLPRLEPAALTVIGPSASAAAPLSPSSDYTVVIGFEDDRARTEQQIAETIAVLGEPNARLEGDEVLRLWRSLADQEDSADEALTFATASNTPAALAPVIDEAIIERLMFHAPAGRLCLPVDAESADETVRRLAKHGFTLVHSRGVRAPEPVISPQAALVALRSRIRRALDPAGSLAAAEWEG